MVDVCMARADRAVTADPNACVTRPHSPARAHPSTPPLAPAQACALQRAAGMRCVVTESGYAAGEFALADAIFPEIGDEGSEQFSLQELCVDFPVDA